MPRSALGGSCGAKCRVQLPALHAEGHPQGHPCSIPPSVQHLHLELALQRPHQLRGPRNSSKRGGATRPPLPNLPSQGSMQSRTAAHLPCPPLCLSLPGRRRKGRTELGPPFSSPPHFLFRSLFLFLPGSECVCGGST